MAEEVLFDIADKVPFIVGEGVDVDPPINSARSLGQTKIVPRGPLNSGTSSSI